VTPLIALVLAAGPCTLEGKVTLTKDGATLSGERIRAVVYVEKATPELPPLQPKEKPHQINQVNRNFDPRVLVVGINETVNFENEDKDEHSVFSNSDNDTFDFPASKKGKTGVHTFINSGPVLLQCDRHAWMRADVLVVKNDFWSIVDGEGRFKIEGLPAGQYTLTLWEPNGGKKQVKVPKACKGPTKLEVPAMEIASDPQLKRKDGSDYPWELRNPY
jgi:plastocyanin